MSTGRSWKPASADRAAVEQAQALGREGEGALPRLLEMLATPSWSVRREVVAQLARLGRPAAEAACAGLRTERKNEVRLAALVDVLVASQGEIDDLIVGLLDEPSLAVVCDGLQVIGRRRVVSAVARVATLTEHDDDNVAVASIEALGQLGGAVAVSRLLSVLSNASFFRSFPAIDVLGRLGDTSAVEPLIALLDDALRGPEAARALGRLGDETAILALLRLLTSPKAATSRVAALALADIHERSVKRYGSAVAFERALAASPDHDSIAARLERGLVGADAAERRAIGTLLGFLSSSASIDSLRPLLDEEGSVAEAAAASLARLARLGNAGVFALLDTLDSERRALLIPHLAGLSEAVPALVRCLADPDVRVRLATCDALAKTGDPSCVPALFELLGDRDISLSQAATGALQALASQQVEELALAAAVGTPKSRRQPALRILGHLGSPRALPVLLDAAQQPDERTREIALLGLSNVGGDAALSALLAASAHDSPRTRAAAVRGLGHLEPLPPILLRLRETTSDPDAWVRYYACQALGNAGDADAAALLLARAEDTAGQVRVAAVDALARLSAPAALEALGRAARHDDPEVRRAALAGIGTTRKRALLPLLLDASYAPETATRLVAASALANFAEPEALRRLCDIAGGDPEPSVQHAAIELLAEDLAAPATVTLVALLSEEGHRSRVVHALARHVVSRTPQLVAALEQAPGDVAEALVTVLTSLPKATGEGVLVAALGLPNEQARRAAARALRFTFDSDTTHQALARSARQDPDPEVRRVAAALLS